MARRNDPFSKRNTKWGTNLISTLIAWGIVAPFAVGSSLSKNTSTYDDEPISKTMAVVLIIIGIALIPLFVPFMMYVDGLFSIFIGIPIGIWIAIIIAVIKAFINNESDDDDDKSKQYTSIVKSILKQSTNSKNNKIKEEYYKIIHFNKSLDKQKNKLIRKIKRYNFKTKLIGILSSDKNKYSNEISIIKNEISNIEAKYIKQVISLDIDENNIKCIIPKDVYIISSSANICQYSEMDFNMFPKSIEKEICFFGTNLVPNLSLQFNSIEFYFFRNFVVIMSKNDFVVVDYKNILIKKSITPIRLHSSNQKINFNVISESWEHTCKNGLPDMRYKNNRRFVYVEIAIVELNIFSENINFVFTQRKDADFLYKLIHDTIK